MALHYNLKSKFVLYSLAHSSPLSSLSFFPAENYTIYAEDLSGNDPNRSLSQAIDWDKLVDDMNV